jgi:hypothetical protein
MRWVSLVANLLMLVCGTVMLLHAYRVIGKPPGADAKYDAQLAGASPTYKVVGWCVVVSSVLGLLDNLVGGLV